MWQGGAMTQRELAEARGVTPRNITGLVDGLEQAGLVQRTAHPSDRRATLVRLTRRGTELVERLEAEQVEFTELLFEGMPRERFEGLTSGLKDILDRIRERCEEHPCLRGDDVAQPVPWVTHTVDDDGIRLRPCSSWRSSGRGSGSRRFGRASGTTARTSGGSSTGRP
ncbi:MarR family winged helix-turn-helix transcriptional regulator [Dactylosporangium sp. NPDC000521]|uniref:MarR family winged helix-turn-helix transcriptional regulator n=1 Tax=Dactylosporangium sp. NPDC000521 TaxID=3363975 RepID=UPI00369819D8